MKGRHIIVLLVTTLQLTSCAGACYQDPETVKLPPSTLNSESEESFDNQESQPDKEKATESDSKNNFIPGEIYSNNGITILAEKIEYGWATTDFSFVFENATDESISIAVDELAINGFMASASVYMPYVKLSSNSKSRETISIDNSLLESAEVSSIATFEIAFNAYNIESVKQLWYSGAVSVPLEKENQMKELSAEIVYQDDYVTVRLGNRNKHEVTYFLQNHSGTTLQFEPIDCSIDGWTYDVWYLSMYIPFDRDIFDKGFVMSTITIDDTFLEESGIDTPKNMSLKFRLESKSDDTKHTTDIISIDL